MAITNAQQYQQLVNKPADGKRPGYRGPGGYQGTKGSSVERPGGNTNRERGITQQYQGPKGTTGRIDRPGADPKPPQVMIGGQSFDLNPTTKEAQEKKNFAISIENDRQRREARKRALKERTFLQKLGKLGYTDRTLDDNLVDIGAIDPQFSTIGGVPIGFAGGFGKAITVDPATNYFDEDSIREIASTKTTTGGSLSAKDADTLGDIREDITMRDRILDPNDNVTQSEFNEYMNRNKIEDTGGDGIQDPCKGPNPPAYCFTGIRSVEPEEEIEENVGRMFRLMADGGMTKDAPVGGIMDIETGRQMYGLGKLVKKATRAVKKIVKSPIGKAALVGAGFGFAGMGPFKGLSGTKFGLGLKDFLAFGNVDKAFNIGSNAFKFGNFLTTPKGAMAGIAALSAAPLLFGQQEEDDEEEQYRGEGLDIANIRANPYTFIPRRFAAEGGSMKEPVAKKTMPLIDMDGKEKDYRETGGFVDMGRMERADDVPARLSKNEFVFTADAVRNAGDGSVDKGAEVMYNMMKNLESGGDVSEESQGLDGAREMFQTSKRLEEVL